ncbi:MAG: DUF1801 domain-containing protein [Candidatus Omnitrophica bacterium]|nr:DUF1801 domain-containing protein [Candidatus Omnitrophota bacterium]MCB0688517.1 DUF1801 domain-containing protein [Saprospiraceae bacterium]
MKKEINTVDEYLSNFSGETLEKLKQMREIIKENAPEAAERISYGMPAYKWKGKPLVYFAGYPKHIGFYATPNGHEHFKKELAGYKQGKGSVQFPIDESLPLDLIRDIVLFRKKSITT